jgi:hypothetical protein
VPAGKTSVSDTLAAALGPLFMTVMVYVTLLPVFTRAAALLVTATSATVVSTVVAAVEELFVDTGSTEAVLTLAVSDSTVPIASPAATCACTWITALAPLGMLAMVSLSCELVLLRVKPSPLICVWERTLRPAGNVSVSETLEAVPGPLFVTVMV